MKGLFSKRVVSVILAIALCFGVAGATFAVNSNSVTTRSITVNTDDVITENYAGVGINHWTSPYNMGMNDAYQLINEKRTNMQQPKYVRMLFMPQWIVDTTLPEEQQQWEWENGIYHFDSIEVQNFFRKVKMYQESGTEVLLNFGGRVSYDIASWWQISDAAVTSGGTRAAPANLEAFADATYAIIKYAWDNGYDNLDMVSFYNEVNGGNFEAFYNKKIYWVQMLKEVHYQLASHTYEGNVSSIHYGKNVRDEITLFGVDLSGWDTNDGVVEFLDYVVENLVDENKKPLYDVLNCHHYPFHQSYETIVEKLNKFGEKYPGIWANEYGHRNDGSAMEAYIGNYKSSELMMQISMSNAGYGGSAVWVVSADIAPSPMNVNFTESPLCMWNYPSQDINNVNQIYGLRMLYTRYIPANCNVYKSSVDSKDIICAAYGLEDGNKVINDMTVLLDVEENSQSRKLTVNLGSKAANKKFKRFVYYFPEKDKDGFERMEDPYEYGDLMPVSDRVLTANENGNIEDILPVNKHCAIVYTTLDEQVQIVTDVNKVSIKSGETASFNIKEIYGTDNDEDLSNVTWEIYGKSRTDTNGGYYMTQNGIGTLAVNGSSATYDSTGTVKGDTVAIKIKSNYEPSAYTIIIVDITD